MGAYHLDEDFSESRDLATEKPEKLKEMIELWWAEAGRNGVLPLDDRRVELWAPSPRAFNPRNRVSASLIFDRKHRFESALWAGTEMAI